MSAAASPSDPRLQRARGTLHIAFRDRDGTTALADLRQEGCLKARFPRPTGWTEAVTLNTSGGIAGGDRLSSTLQIAQNARATFSAQAAERFYRALPADPPAHVRTSITLQAGAAAEWLPQESILFDRCALDRALQIDMAADACFLGVECLVFGRALMGETVRQARLSDTIRIRRDGRLILHDAIRLNGDVAATLARSASGKGAGAVATLAYVAPDAASRLHTLRDAWTNTPVEAAASTWNNMLVGRIVASDAASLRTTLVAGLNILRDGRALPRVWNC